MNGTNLRCSILDLNLEQTRDTFITSIFTCIFNAVFSLFTSTGNTIILNVIWKTPELHSPSFMLLLCLSASDLLVGLICQPLFVAYQIAELLHNFRAYCILRMTQNISGWITVGVSLFTLSAVSIDRLLALTLHLRYSSIVTSSRVLKVAIFLWIGNVTVVILRFWIKKLEFYSFGRNNSFFSGYSSKFLENFLDRSQTPASDKTATGECPTLHGKHAQM